MEMESNIHTFISCDKPFEKSKTVLFGAPFDGTTSYRPGARFAPSAIRSESFGIETYSPYQDMDLCDLAIYDGGDLELPFGNTRRVLTIIEEYTGYILGCGKLPLMIGGEHLVTLGAVSAAYRRNPELCIVHLDAHADFRSDYMGETLSHASVIRRCHDILGDGRIFQFGIRSGDRQEFLDARGHVYTNMFNLNGMDTLKGAIGVRPVYLTIDIDVLDPSVCPGTGTPEAGGVSFLELMWGLCQLKGMNIIGADFVELSPALDTSGTSTALACKLLRELMMILK